jgi:hypothetical protein
LIDLSPFCADPYPHPFTQGDYTYATNLHVLVRVPKREGHAIDLDTPVWELAKALARVDVAQFGPVEFAEHLHYPRNTDVPLHMARIGVAWFNLDYVNRISSLPNLEISRSGQLEPMPFRFTGGVGLLMPMKPPIKKAA